MCTMNIIDTTSHKARDFLEMIGKSLAYPGCNAFSGAVPFCEMLVALNPICAEIVAGEMPRIEDVQECLWHFSSVDASHLQALHRGQRSEEHTSELQSLMRIPIAGFGLK